MSATGAGIQNQSSIVSLVWSRDCNTVKYVGPHGQSTDFIYVRSWAHMVGAYDIYTDMWAHMVRALILYMYVHGPTARSCGL